MVAQQPDPRLPLPQARRPRQCIKPALADRGDDGGTDGLPRRIAQRLFAQHQGTEPALAPRQYRLGPLVPFDDIMLGDAVGEMRLKLGFGQRRSEEHTSELQSLMRISY